MTAPVPAALRANDTEPNLNTDQQQEAAVESGLLDERTKDQETNPNQISSLSINIRKNQGVDALKESQENSDSKLKE